MMSCSDDPVLSHSSPDPGSNNRHVAILMATYQGAAYIRAQLESIRDQTHSNWALWVSDDGSTDSTLAILRAFQTEQGAHRVHLLEGPQRGFAANFFFLLSYGAITADVYAFCDQDDLWEPNKLSVALEAIDQAERAAGGRTFPVLYGCRTRLIDAQSQPYGYSPCFQRSPDFHNAVVQSIMGANTMVFNAAASGLARLCPIDPVPSISHDWWMYLVITGCGGTVIYDPQPWVQYRQHGGNLVGTNRGWWARAQRAYQLVSGAFRVWNAMHIRSLQTIRSHLTPEAQQGLHMLEILHAGSWLTRIRVLWRSGFYRQSKLDTAGLWLAILIGRF